MKNFELNKEHEEETNQHNKIYQTYFYKMKIVKS